MSAAANFSRWWRSVKRALLAVDAFVDSSMYEGGRRSLAILKAIAAFSDGLHVSGVRKALIDLTCEGLNLSIVVLLGVLALAQPAFRLTSDEDWLKRQDLAVTFLDRYGVEVGRRGIKHDDAIPFDELPDHFIKAVLATEDRRFFDHFGIDVVGTMRALTVNAHAGGVVQGGSSITQQLAKNLFLSNERSISRKINEAYLALWLEHHLTKKQILSLYLDRAYMGGGAFGVQAAAQYYFGKSARDINLPEAAMLAGLFKAPTKYSPDVNLPAARARANDVLSNLVDAGFMTEGQVYAARRNPATPVSQNAESSPDWYLDFAFDEVKALADSGKLGADRVLTVRTGLDTGLQAKTDAVLEDMLRVNAPAYNAHQAAAVVADTDGLVRAMFGGRDYGESQYNRATDAARQPGSSFKIFDYMTALLTGKYHKDTTVQAGGICIGDYCVHNFGGESGGAMPLYQALAQSYNTAAIWISVKIGEVYWPAKQALSPSQDRRARALQDRRDGAKNGADDAARRHRFAAGRRRRSEDDRHGRRQRHARQRRQARDALRGDRDPQFGRGELIYTHAANGTPPVQVLAGRQGRRDEQHHDPRAHRRHRPRRADPGPRHLRQDRHDKWADQRLVQRLHRQSGRQRLVRQRRQHVDDRRHARRRAAGADLARDHDLRASGPRDQAALRRAAGVERPDRRRAGGQGPAPASSKRRGSSACRRSRRTSSSRSATTRARPRSTAPSRPPSVTPPGRRRRHRRRPRRRRVAVESRLTSRVELAIFPPRLVSHRRRAGPGLPT